MSSSLLRCSGVSVSYPSKGAPVDALKDVSFQVKENEFLSIVGPSGCGKTSLLRVIAGLLPATAGTLEFHGGRKGGFDLAPMVFQENCLFPWMTVLDNATFGLEMQKVGREGRERSARTLLARFGLEGRENAYPYQLSLGMKQRVAIVRAFLTNAPLTMMDEPFAALDYQSRLLAQQELLDFWQQDRKTVVFVTHDVEEAIVLSDRIVVLTPSPGMVAAEYEVPLPRPRRRLLEYGESIADLKLKIFTMLKLPGETVGAAYA